MDTARKKNVSRAQIVRRIIQIAAFLLFPGLFISTFSAVRAVYTAVLSGSFSLTALAWPLLLLAAVFPVTILFGRFFCGYLCAFGAMGDFFWFLSRKLRKKQPRISAKADRYLKLLKYGILLFIVVVFWTLAVPLDSTMNPWTIFGMYASAEGWASLSGLFTVGAALLLLILVGSMLVERFFCRYLCPLGAIFSLTSRFRLFRIKKPRSKCGSCRLCTWKCSMGIDLGWADTVTSGECINCFGCVDVCPRHNAKTTPAPAVAATAAAAVMTGLYYAGSLTSQNLSGSTGVSAAVMENASVRGQYQDGVYTGSGSGYKGQTSVQVTVKNGYITDVTVLSTGDDAQFFSQAKRTVLSEILSQQSAQVSAVTGATFSSNGIMAAVADALRTAGGGTDAVPGASGEESAAPSEAAGGSSGTDAQAAISQLADGVYRGTGTGFRGDTAVSVTVSGGKIQDITVESYEDDPEFFTRAESGVIAGILKQQSLSVDAVTGATYSSNGILEAVADALDLSYGGGVSAAPAQGQGQHHGSQGGTGGGR